MHNLIFYRRSHEKGSADTLARDISYSAGDGDIAGRTEAGNLLYTKTVQRKI